MKSDADSDLISAVEALANRRTFFTARAAEMLLNGFSSSGSSSAEPQAIAKDRLTPRQREIVQLLAEGKSSKEVAVALGISVKTAESHRTRLMQKLDIHETASLVRYAVRRGLVQA